MAYIASQIDYDLAKKSNPNADVRLYTPGMSIGANDVVLGGSAVIPDSALNGAQRVWGADRNATNAAFQNYDTNVRPIADMKNSLQSQLTAQTNLYNQQASDQAARIRQAIERQKQQAESTKTDYTNQMNMAIGTLNAERAKIPGQITNLNNQASSRGMINAQHIRNALAQMGLLQSGESASQQLLNDTTVQNNINANNLQGQQIDTSYGDKIASAQTDLASKVKAINDAIALAQSQGDEQSLMALQDAQAKIANAAAQGAVDYNNWAYKYGQDATQNRQWQQTFDANQVQNNIDNIYRQTQADLANRQWQDNFGLQQAQLAASIAKASSSGSGNGPTSTNLSEIKYQNELTSQKGLAQSMQGLQKMASNGATRSDILKFINSNAGDLQANGVNVQELYKWAASNFTWDKDGNGEWYDTTAK